MALHTRDLIPLLRRQSLDDEAKDVSETLKRRLAENSPEPPFGRRPAPVLDRNVITDGLGCTNSLDHSSMQVDQGATPCPPLARDRSTMMSKNRNAFALLLAYCGLISPLFSQFTLSPGPMTAIGSTVQALRATDLDGDGFRDLVAKTGGNIAVVSSVCQGSYGASAFVGSALLPAYPEAYAVGDVDLDGLPDIVMAAASFPSTTAELRVLRNLGDGSFGPPQVFPVIPPGTPGFIPQAIAMTLADMDGDGDLDVAVATHVNGLVNGDGFYTIVLNQTVAGGSLAFATAVNISSTEASASEILAADLDNDGDMDLVLPHLFDVSVTVFLNDGSGISGSVTKESLSGANTSGPSRLAAADLNGDGFLDVVALRPQSYSVLLNLDGGSNLANAGKLRSQPQVPLGPLGITTAFQPTDIGLADLDEDGATDMILTLSGNFGTPGSVAVLPGSASMTFGSAANFLAGHNLGSLVLEDLDGDSDTDIAVIDPAAGMTFILDNLARTPWQDLGQALAGTHGDPCATGTGSLEGGAIVTFRLRNALENSAALVLVSPVALNMP
ncbi:MAG TPA: VCBS repeat-containing protein, partial [Planctomycetes bacterium]|nr:VCBS repeat-containing protein [Planctomycetota bacterium]